MPGRGDWHNAILRKTMAKAPGLLLELSLEQEEGAMTIHH